jgi:hypothetical protein
VQLEELGKLKKCSDLIGNETRDLPACNIVPQPTELALAPKISSVNINLIMIIYII